MIINYNIIQMVLIFVLVDILGNFGFFFKISIKLIIINRYIGIYDIGRHTQ